VKFCMLYRGDASLLTIWACLNRCIVLYYVRLRRKQRKFIHSMNSNKTNEEGLLNCHGYSLQGSLTS
jgi:hypothetical protein